MSFADLMTADRRLVILRILERAPGYTANSSILHSQLDHTGHRCSRDQVKGDVAWLEEQGLVKAEDVGFAVVATVTDRGCDVALGRAIVPGVKRPSPI